MKSWLFWVFFNCVSHELHTETPTITTKNGAYLAFASNLTEHLCVFWDNYHQANTQKKKVWSDIDKLVLIQINSLSSCCRCQSWQTAWCSMQSKGSLVWTWITGVCVCAAEACLFFACYLCCAERGRWRPPDGIWTVNPVIVHASFHPRRWAEPAQLLMQLFVSQCLYIWAPSTDQWTSTAQPRWINHLQSDRKKTSWADTLSKTSGFIFTKLPKLNRRKRVRSPNLITQWGFTASLLSFWSK